MDSDKPITPATTMSSCHAISGGTTKTRGDMDAVIRADLAKSEGCSVETLLGVLLEYCRESPQPSVPNPHTPRLPSTDSTPKGSPESSGTARASVVKSPKLNAGDSPSNPPAQPNLLQKCLNEVLTLCKEEDLVENLREFKNSGKEKARYVPLKKLLNHALAHLGRVSLEGVRPASDLQVLFVVSDPKRINWRPGSTRSPDLAILSLNVARQIFGQPSADWHSLAGEDGLPAECVTVEWPDIVASVELKWNHHPIPSNPPKNYSTDLGDPIGHLTVYGDRVDLTGVVSSNATSTATSLASSESVQLSTGSTSLSDSGPVISNVEEGVATSSKPGRNKRLAIDLDSNHSGPRKKHQGSKSTRKDAPLQSGGSGAEMLHCSPGRHHAFGLVIIDSTLWVWWYDPQGAIQSTGIDFIHNLPHMLVLLFIMQRFDLTDWGFNPELDPSILLRHQPQSLATGDSLPGSSNGEGKGSAGSGDPAIHSSTNDTNGTSGKSKAFTSRIQVASAQVVVDPKTTVQYNVPMRTAIHEPFCLKGRSTKCFGVTTASDTSTAPDDSTTPYVAKLYWPHSNRCKEEDIIQGARDVQEDLENHLPLVIASRDIDAVGTVLIRQQLGIAQNSPCLPRVLRMIIFERLTRITELQGDDLLIALVECMKCNFVLWQSGIRHQDVSLANLMIRMINGRWYGVLNDWDLSYSTHHRKEESEKDLTATIPYVAVDLLRKRRSNPDATVKRLYYYDLESFFWVMIYVFLSFANKKCQKIPMVNRWQTGDMEKSLLYKRDFLMSPLDYKLCEEWQAHKNMAFETSGWVRSCCDQLQVDEGNDQNELDKDLDLLRGFVLIVGRSLKVKMPGTPVVEGL